MAFRFPKAIAGRFDDEIRFFKGWMHQPRSVGSVVPTSGITARRMASVIDLGSNLPVLELGPGTGVVTKAILESGVAPERLVCVEYASEFVAHLRKRFPAVRVLQGDAFDLGAALAGIPAERFDAAVSALPLLSFPVARRVRYLEGVLDRLAPGRPVVQLCYGPCSPVPANPDRYSTERLDFVFRNFPPAQLWLYRRPLSH